MNRIVGNIKAIGLPFAVLLGLLAAGFYFQGVNERKREESAQAEEARKAESQARRKAEQRQEQIEEHARQLREKLQQDKEWLASLSPEERKTTLEARRRERIAKQSLSTEEEIAAQALCEKLVKRQLVAPATAEFEWAASVPSDIDTWELLGQVTSSNRFGVPLSHPFVCTMGPEKANGLRDFEVEL